MPFVGSDWRSPGDKWIRTEFGWKRLADIRNNLNIQLVQQLRNLAGSGSSSSTSSISSTTSSSKTSSRQLSRKGSPVGDAAARPQSSGSYGKRLKVKSKNGADSKASSSCRRSVTREAKERAWEREQRLRQLHLMLDQRCISARTSSRESNQYSTISDAISKLNFHQALHDENCFPFICKVVKLLLESYYWTLSGSTQTTLLRIIDAAKDIVLVSRMHSGLVLKKTEAALTTLDKGRRQHMMGFALRSTDSKIKSLLKTRKQLQEQMLVQPGGGGPSTAEGGMEFTKLPNDCIRLIVSHLSHPRDVLNLGQADVRLHTVTEENWVWRELTHHHYGEVNFKQSRADNNETGTWKQIFMQEYKESRGQLRGELFRAVCLCKICSYVYWKDYGHPCSGALLAATDQAIAAAVNTEAQHQEQGLTAEQFLHLFIH